MSFADTVRAPLYFAYGSNMDEAQMRARVPGAKKLGVGYLKDHEFIFSGFSQTWNGSVANVRKKKGSIVWGVVYDLPPGGLAKLDRYEGFPHSYQRKSKDVMLRSGGSVTAVLYYKRQVSADAPPNPLYVRRILAALKAHGIQ